MSDIARNTPSDTSAISASAGLRVGQGTRGAMRGSRLASRMPASRQGTKSGSLKPTRSNHWWARMPTTPHTWIARIARRNEK